MTNQLLIDYCIDDIDDIDIVIDDGPLILLPVSDSEIDVIINVAVAASVFVTEIDEMIWCQWSIDVNVSK